MRHAFQPAYALYNVRFEDLEKRGQVIDDTSQLAEALQNVTGDLVNIDVAEANIRFDLKNIMTSKLHLHQN